MSRRDDDWHIDEVAAKHLREGSLHADGPQEYSGDLWKPPDIKNVRSVESGVNAEGKICYRLTWDCLRCGKRAEECPCIRK